MKNEELRMKNLLMFPFLKRRLAQIHTDFNSSFFILNSSLLSFSPCALLTLKIKTLRLRVSAFDFISNTDSSLKKAAGL